jgi:uncharacterized protein
MLPITLTTASLLAVLLFVLSIRVIQARVKNGVSLGIANHPELEVRVRSQANLIEYAPIVLILMGLIESAGGSRTILLAAAAVFIVARLAHPLGMPKPAPNALRFVGTIGSFLTLVSLGIYGMILAIPAL